MASCERLNREGQKIREFFFLLLRVFFYSLLLLLPKLLQGLLATWLQAQKHTRVHSLDVNLKTHAQEKQMYVGLHHLVQILYCNQTLCVCVCVGTCSQDLKLATKQALELFVPSSLLPPELETSQLIICLWCRLSLTYVVASYGCCWSCCSYSTMLIISIIHIIHQFVTQFLVTHVTNGPWGLMMDE